MHQIDARKCQLKQYGNEVYVDLPRLPAVTDAQLTAAANAPAAEVYSGEHDGALMYIAGYDDRRIYFEGHSSYGTANDVVNGELPME